MNIMTKVYWAAGMACVAYYLVFSLWSRFGLSLSGLWLLLGVVFAVSGFLVGHVPMWISIAWRSLMAVGLAGMLALLVLVGTGMSARAPANLDYIIVLGARVDPDGSPSPALRRRLNAALAYLEDSPDTVVIASGGQGSDEPMTEAKCIREELIAAGIASERVLLEDRSTTTEENLQFSRELMTAPDASVGLVTNNFHVYRAQLLAKSAGLTDAYGIAAEYTGPTLLHYMVREAVCLIVYRLRGSL